MMILQRREFITLLGGAAAWPLPARAQQDNRVRRVGGLMAGDENDPESERRVLAFKQALADLGWSNVRMDLRWPGGDINRIDTCILRWVTLANINVAKVPIFP
jgi:putative ABC transport system substrate-binding protein